MLGAGLFDQDATADITEIVYGDGNRITQAEAQAAFALDRAMLCTASMPLATCLQTITDARRDRSNAALGLIADLIPIIGGIKVRAECWQSLSALNCGGALLGFITTGFGVTKLLLKRGGTVVEVTVDGRATVAVEQIDNPSVELVLGRTCVYICVVNGVTRYVGITDDFALRAAEHLRQKGIFVEEIPGPRNLSRDDARAVERVYIVHYGVEKNGGTLMNIINSISPVKNINN